MRFLLFVIGSLFVISFSGLVIADADLGKRKAAQACAACHGAQGISMAPRTPHLAGQDPDYLMEQLRHYRSGKRSHEVMGVIARSLSEQDLEAVAAWYGSNRITLEKAD
jgi:cytochrome c553